MPRHLRHLLLIAIILACIALPTTAAIAAPSLPASGNFDFRTNTGGNETQPPTVDGGIPPGVQSLTTELNHGCEHLGGPSPTIVVTAGGTISGGCNQSVTVTVGVGYTETITGTYSGTMNTSNGHITFAYATSYRQLYTSGKDVRYEISISGSSANASNFGSSGRVTYSLARTCVPGNSVCSANESHSYTGTIFFTFGISAITDDDTKVDRIEVVQVTQKADNSVPLVAGKATVARVFVSSGIGREDVTVTLKGRRNGDLEAPMKLPGGAEDAIPVPNRNLESNSFNFRLPASWVSGGPIELEAEVKFVGGIPDSNTANNNKIQAADFQERSKLKIAYIDVCTDGNANFAQCPAPGYETASRFLETVYPVADNGVQYQRAPITSIHFDGPPPTTSANIEAIEVLIRKEYDLLKLGDPEGAPDQLVGWTGDNDGPHGGSSDPGFAGGKGRGAYAVWYLDNGAFNAITLAHEVAHNLGRRHTATPDSCDSKDSATDWPHGTSYVQDPGWDFRTDTVTLPTMFDFMSYCYNEPDRAWVSPFTYTNLFNANSIPPGVVSARVVTNYLVVSGTASANGSGGTLDNTLTVSSSASFPAASLTGTHCLRFDDTPARDFCFTLTFKDSDDGALAQEHFNAVVPLATPFNSLKLCKSPCGPSDTLATKSRSANNPYAFFQLPLPNAAIEGDETTIAWSGMDLDPATTLTYSIFHSADGGQTFVPLLLDSTELSLTFDPDVLAGGPEGAFKIVVSDGLNTFEDIVGGLTVGNSRPWGDLRCNGVLGLDDAVALRRHLAGLENGAQAPGCAPVGNLATVYGVDTDVPWGDLRCNGVVGADDALDLLKAIAGLAVAPGTGQCPDIGEPVFATG